MRIPDEIKKFFKTVPVMAFSTTHTNGTLNVVAIASMKIVNEDTVLVIDTFFDKTKENILQNNKVAIALWKGSEGYQIKGIASYHSSGKVFEEAKEWILKLKPNKIVKGVVEINVTKIYSITSSCDKAGKRII